MVTQPPAFTRTPARMADVHVHVYDGVAPLHDRHPRRRERRAHRTSPLGRARLNWGPPDSHHGPRAFHARSVLTSRRIPRDPTISPER